MTLTAQLLSKTPRVVHDHDWRGGLLWMLCAVLALGMLDKWDNADYWQKEAEKANRRAVDLEAYANTLPPVAFVLDARNRKELDMRIATVAGELDTWRGRK